MKRIAEKLSINLGMSCEECELLLKNALHSDNPEQELFDILGEDGIGDISSLLSSKKDRWKVPSEHIVKSFDTHVDSIMAPKIGRNTTDLYDEYILEAAEKAKEIPLVGVERISSRFREVFQEYKTFNQVQSLVFESIYMRKENVLVSAPTGAGKTDIALLGIVKHLEGEPRHIESKIAYIAPMKALAGEITEKFKRRLPKRVEEYTGDSSLTKEEIEGTTLLICTPEKFDLSTRKLSSYLNETIGMVILDEVHILNETRGAVIESIVTRMKMLEKRQQKRIRIIGISATLPNPVDVAEFLSVSIKNFHVFSREYRPVPIRYSVIGTRKTVDMSLGEYMKRLDTREKMVYTLFEKLESFLKENHQVIIFVHTRGDCLRVAEEISELVGEERNALPEHILLPANIEDIYKKGIGIHHAGLTKETRRFIEEAFREKRIQLLVCTSTLAWGVNLPARVVVIFGTSYYSPETCKREDISILDVQQMFGRAGRPQYDTQAVGMLITEHTSLTKYVRMLRAEDPIESVLLRTLPARMCAEMYLRHIRSQQEAIEWMKSTFLWVRMKKAPEKYGTICTEKENALNDYTLLTIERLKSLDLVSSDCQVTELGRVISHYSITEYTLLAWNELLGKKQEKALLYFTEAEEFAAFPIRADDRNGLGLKGSQEEIDKEVKIKILLDKHIQKRILKGYTLAMDQRQLLDNADRLLTGLSEYFQYKKHFHMSDRALYIKKQLERSGKQVEMLSTSLSLSHKPNSIYFSAPITGLIYMKENGATIRITRAFGMKEYLITSSKHLIGIAPIEKKLIINSRIEVVPVRAFSEYEIWLVDSSLSKICGYSLSFSEVPQEQESTDIEFRNPDNIQVCTLPRVSNQEFRELLIQMVYEELKRRAPLKEKVAIIVPEENDEKLYQNVLKMLSITEKVSFEPVGRVFSGNNGITTSGKQNVFPWLVCITSVQAMHSMPPKCKYIFCGFSRNGILYKESILRRVYGQSVLIYEREHEAEYIKQRYT
ncbi:activating signal cointegrator complex subunit 3 [Nematocida sp. LUAm3]|nr:activating signal cointegrator complex subunit 3 [Nematocida sp. LUAm3]KAI5173956.1 activating signal cointegrator complex subunit 3 [Nematocida sp. LUAm2]KAI5177299.1 activating signal cointegrator complex subunit 3 [Nematocida sp. LUAm1]